MELRHLRYFVALAEHLNFTRAAAVMHVTQSTLSHQIKQLEAEIGEPLFDRIGKRVVITETGTRLLASATRALREIDAGLRDIKGQAEQLAGHLRVGSTHTFNLSVIPACVATFLHRHPFVRVTVRELASPAVVDGVAAGALDVGIAYRPPPSLNILFEPLFNDELVLVVSPNHPFAGRKRMRMIELHRQKLVLSTSNTTTRQMLDEWFRSVGAEPVVVAEVDPIGPVLDLVRRLEIAGIVSRLALPNLKDLRIIPLQNPTPIRVPGILWNRDTEQTAAAQSFAVIVRSAVLRAETAPPREGGSAAAPAPRAARRRAGRATIDAINP